MTSNSFSNGLDPANPKRFLSTVKITERREGERGGEREGVEKGRGGGERERKERSGNDKRKRGETRKEGLRSVDTFPSRGVGEGVGLRNVFPSEMSSRKLLGRAVT